MISIITCSIKPDICRKMTDSVSNTIGLEHEIIVFDNHDTQYGLCKIYNESAQKAKFDYLCFVHEDVEFKSENWGEKLIDFADKNRDCGVIGLAGSRCAARNFAGYWKNEDKNNILYNIYHPKNGELSYLYNNPENKDFSEVLVLDGVFLFVKKTVWQEIKFDENTFNGFHFYDADFTYASAQKYKNYVFFNMEAYHFSGGNTDKAFYENMFLFQKKWKNKLPYSLPEYKVSFLTELELAGNAFTRYIKTGFPIIQALKNILYINGIIFLIFSLLYRIKRKITNNE